MRPAFRCYRVRDPRPAQQGGAGHLAVGWPQRSAQTGGPADHLGLNPAEPATCFPTAATVANSWDPALGEEIGKALGEETASYSVNVILGPA